MFKPAAMAGVGWLLLCNCAKAPDRSVGPMDVVVACEQQAAVECMREDACQGGLATLVHGSVAGCTTRLAEACERRATSSGTGYGSAELDACTAAQEAQTCDEWIGTLTPGCGSVGTKANGAGCRFGSQCASGFCDQFLLFTERNVCGRCASPPVEGGSCNSSCGGSGAISCEHDTSGAGRCVRLGLAGESCDAVAACAIGLSCAMSADVTTGLCQPATGNDGAPCDDLAGPFCDYRRGIFCNAQTHVCGVGRRVSPGGACGVLADGSFGLCAQGFCRADPANTTAGTCVAYLPDGAACTFGPGSAVSCAPPALCLSGFCRIGGGDFCN